MIIQDLHEAYKHIQLAKVNGRNRYVDSNTGQVLTGVTTLIKKYQRPFPMEYMSKKKANDWGMTQEAVKAMWKKKGMLGSASGNIVHDYLEDKILGKYTTINYSDYRGIDSLDTIEFTKFHKKCDKLIQYADEFIADFIQMVPIRTELIVGNDQYMGMVDLLAYDPKDNKYILIDYKTDKKIDRSNRFQNFKRPLTHLDDCEYNKYSLQLNIYRKMLQPVIDIDDLYIIWFNTENDSYVKIQIEKDDKNIDLIL